MSALFREEAALSHNDVFPLIPGKDYKQYINTKILHGFVLRKMQLCVYTNWALPLVWYCRVQTASSIIVLEETKCMPRVSGVLRVVTYSFIEEEAFSHEANRNNMKPDAVLAHPSSSQPRNRYSSRRMKENCGIES